MPSSHPPTRSTPRTHPTNASALSSAATTTPPHPDPFHHPADPDAAAAHFTCLLTINTPRTPEFLHETLRSIHALSAPGATFNGVPFSPDQDDFIANPPPQLAHLLAARLSILGFPNIDNEPDPFTITTILALPDDSPITLTITAHQHPDGYFPIRSITTTPGPDSS